MILLSFVHLASVLLSLLCFISFVEDCSSWFYSLTPLKVRTVRKLATVSLSKESPEMLGATLNSPHGETLEKGIVGEKTRPIKLNYRSSVDRLEGLQLVLNELLVSKQKRFTDRKLQIQSIIEVCERLFASGVYEQIILLFHLFLNHDNYRHLEASTTPKFSQKIAKTALNNNNLVKSSNERHNHRYALFSDRLDRLSTELTSSPQFLLILIRSFVAMDDVDTAIQLLQLYSNKGILFSAESKSLLITQLAESSVVGLQAALKIRTSMLRKNQPLTLQASISLLNGLYEFSMKKVSLKEDSDDEKENKVTEDKLIINFGAATQHLFKKMSSKLELSPLQVMELANEIFQGAFPSDSDNFASPKNSEVKSELSSEMSSRETHLPPIRPVTDRKKKQLLVQSFVRILFRYSIYSVEQSLLQEQDFESVDKAFTEQQRTLQLMKDAAYYSEIDENFFDEVEILTNQISQEQREEKSGKSQSVEVLREEGVVRGIAVSLTFLSEINYKLDLKIMEVLIEECLLEDEILGVKYLFAMMKKLKIYSKTKTFHLLLKAYQSKIQACKTEDERMKAAKQAVLIAQELMQASNHTKPNIQTYELLLTTITEVVDKTSQPSLTHELSHLAMGLIEELGCHPQYRNSFFWTKSIFHSLLTLRLKMRLPYIPVLQEMITSSVQPDYHTIRLIYDGLAQEKDSRQLIELYALQMKGELSRRNVTKAYLEAIRMRYYNVLPEDQAIFHYIQNSTVDPELQKKQISAKQLHLYLPSLTSDGVAIIMKHLIALGKISDAYDVFHHFLKFSRDQIVPQVPYVASPSSDLLPFSSSQATENRPIHGFERYAQQPSAEMFTVLLEGFISGRSMLSLSDVMVRKYNDRIEDLRRLLIEWELTPTKQWFHLLIINDGAKSTSLIPAIEQLESLRRYYIPSFETLNSLFHTFNLIQSKFEKVLTLEKPSSSGSSVFPEIESATQVARTAAQNYLTNQLRVLASCLQQIDEDPRYDLSGFSQEYLFQVYSNSFVIGKLLQQMEDAGFYSSYGPEPKSGIKSSSPVICVSLNVINALLQGLQYEPLQTTIASNEKFQIVLNRRKTVKKLLLTLGESGIVPDDDVMDYFDLSGIDEEAELEEDNEITDQAIDVDREGSKVEKISLFAKEYDDYQEISSKRNLDISSDSTVSSFEEETMNKSLLLVIETQEDEKDSLQNYVKLFEHSIYRPYDRNILSNTSNVNEGTSFYDEYKLIIDEEKNLFQDILFNHSAYAFPSSQSTLELFDPEKEKQIIFREAVKATEKRFRQIEDKLNEVGSAIPRRTKSILAHLMKESYRERVIPYLSEIRQRLILQMYDRKHKYKSWKHYRQAIADRQFVASNSNLASPSKQNQSNGDDSDDADDHSGKKWKRKNPIDKKKETSAVRRPTKKPSPVVSDEEIRLSSKRSWNKKFFANSKSGTPNG